MNYLENKSKLDPNLFTNVDIEEDFEITVAEPFKKKYYYTYNGTDNAYSAKLFGNPKTTGVETTGLVHEPDYRFSVSIWKTKEDRKKYFSIKAFK